MRNKIVMLVAMVIHAFIISMIIFLLYLLASKVLKKNINKKKMLIDYGFIWYLCTLLEVTGVIGVFRMTQFKWEWFRNSLELLTIALPRNTGEFIMLLCNCMLFIPLGFLLPVVFRKMNGVKVFIISLMLVVAIELLQAAGGRMLEVNDIVMNIMGSLIGYLIYTTMMIAIRKRRKDNNN